MSELCEHETFRDICGTCHRDAQITRLRAEVEQNAIDLEEYRRDVERLRSVTVVQETLIRKAETENEKLAEALETAGRLFVASRDALAEVNTENERLAADLDGYMTAANDYMRENEKLRAALELYREAVRIDATMEGPKFMGSNASALKRAWDADRATLEEK